LLLQRPHDLAVWGRGDKLLKRSFAFPHRQGPKLPLKDMRQQRVAKNARRSSQLTSNAPRVEQECAQIAKTLQRENCQQNEIVPLGVWLAKGGPWFRRHSASSIGVAATGPARWERRCVENTHAIISVA